MAKNKVLTKELAADDASGFFNEFTAIEDDAAESLSKHEGILSLYLNGLTSLSDAAEVRETRVCFSASTARRTIDQGDVRPRQSTGSDLEYRKAIRISARKLRSWALDSGTGPGVAIKAGDTHAVYG